MIDITTLFSQVAVLVLMIVPGFLLAAFHLTGENCGKYVSNIILYAAQPALIVDGFLSVDYGTDVLLRMAAVFLLAVVVHLMFFGCSVLLYRRAPEKQRQVLTFATVFTNAGYMGIPLLCALFADTHPEVAVYASVYVTVFNIFAWSLGAYLYTGEKKYISVRKMFLNPSTISTAVGMVFFLLSAIPSVREAVIIPFVREGNVLPPLIRGMKGLVAPLAMFIIGLRLKEVNFKKAFCDKYLYICLFFSMFVLPALVWGVIKVLSLAGIYSDPLSESVLLLSAAAPSATMTSMFAEKYDGDARYAGLLVSISSVLCVVSMPLVSLLTKI